MFKVEFDEAEQRALAIPVKGEGETDIDLEQQLCEPELYLYNMHDSTTDETKQAVVLDFLDYQDGWTLNDDDDARGALNALIRAFRLRERAG